MEKKEIFSKINIKDYNNQLEKILAKKAFSSDTKNLLLDMLYKIENSYEDYKTVKVDVKQKKEMLEEVLNIIEKDCKEIEVNNNNKTSNIDLKTQKITTQLNAQAMLFCLYQIAQQKFIVDKEYEIIKPSIETVLNCGYSMNASEVIRDFDGWSWNIVINDIENLICNFIFQSIIMMAGFEFIKEWKTSNKEYYFYFESFLEKKYKITFSKAILKIISELAILYYIEIDDSEKQRLIKRKEELQEQFDKIQNKKEYLQNLLEEKQQHTKEIGNIDKILNNDRLLKEEFIKRNEKLDFQHRIFSLSDLTDIMQKERASRIKKINECSKKQEPMNYVKNKNQISDSLELLENLDKDSSQILETKIVELINLTKEIMSKQIKDMQEKKDIINMIYKIRYYKLLFVEPNKRVKDFVDFKDIEKQVITAACNKKMLNILSLDVEENYEIIKEIFKINIIKLEEIFIEFKKKNNKIVLNIYDETNFDSKIEYDNIKELNIKFDKKIKIFT